MKSVTAFETTPHFQPHPDARTGFVFICPGRFEAQRNMPCAAGTGANLARALPGLHQRRPELFASADRGDYLITNAWSRVEYPASTGRSVPTEAEVLEPVNLARLAAEITQLETLVVCGAQAHAAVRALLESGRIGAKVAFGRHLSQRSVNMIRGASDTAGRIARWCEEITAQFP